MGGFFIDAIKMTKYQNKDQNLGGLYESKSSSIFIAFNRN